jgi:hypothetical protein
MQRWWREESWRIRKDFIAAQAAWEGEDKDGLGFKIMRGDIGYVLGGYWTQQLQGWLQEQEGGGERTTDALLLLGAVRG